MKRNHKELEAIIDNVTARIRAEEPSAETATSAADRVWARIAAEANLSAAAPAEEAATVEHIRGCADFQQLIPTYLKGQLSDARRLLLEDHTQECIPCRKALKEARSGRISTRAAQPAAQMKTKGAQPPVWRWAIAATLVVGFTFAAYTLYQRYTYSYGVAGTVDVAQGTVYKVTDTDSRPLAVGEKIERGEKIRTAKDAGAVVRLNDGSLVEMRERSEFYVSEDSHGTTVNLARGNVIVEAAKQHDRHLYVRTEDALVSVTGTIFSVNSATKGSRVSVIEGEVHVDHQGQDTKLLPGDQTTTNASLEKIAIKDEVKWSRNAERYSNLMTQLAAMRKDLNTKVTRPGVRYSTHLLDLMPEGTVLYGALPNLTGTIAESHKIMQERIKQNPALREWWSKENGGDKNSANLNQVIDRVREFGKYLGSEIAVGAQLGAKGEPENPLVIGELSDAAGFRPFLEQQIEQLKAQGANGPSIRIIDDPATAAPQSADGKAPEILVWIQGDIFAAAPKLEQLQRLAATIKAPDTNAFTQSPFYARLRDTYDEGAGLIVAADLEKIVPQMMQQDAKQSGGEQRAAMFRELGLTNLKHFMVEQKEADGKTLSRAMLTFNETKHGLPSWLAAPGPMGALDFISPDANIVAAFVVKEPAALVDDLLGALEKVQPDLRKQLDELQTQHGLDVRKDFAAPLGGEFAFTIDGPILPTPSWKMIFEVYDQPKLQQTFERIVDEVNREAAKDGKGGLQWERADSGGYTFYTLRSLDFGLEVHYTYANGYLIVAASNGLLSNAIRYRDAGHTLLHSARFKSALPSDGNANFSAIFYHDLAPLLEPLAERAAKSKNLSEEQQAAIRQLGADQPPTLAYAYAQGDRIVLAANTEGGPFGISPATLLGMPNALELQHVIGDAMGKDKGQQQQGK